MKLYSLLEDIILEAIKITPNGVYGKPTDDMIKDILENPRRVTIMYQGHKEEKPSQRQVDVIAYGAMKGSNNKAIRVYQPFGFTMRTNGGDGKGFKTLLIDNISYWQPTNLQLYNTTSYDTISNEIGIINKGGDESFNTVYGIANFVTGKKLQVSKPTNNNPITTQNNKKVITPNKVEPTNKTTYNNTINPNNKQLPTKKIASRYED